MSKRFFIGKSRRKSSRLTEEGKRFLEAGLVNHVKYIDQGVLFLYALLNKVMRVEKTPSGTLSFKRCLTIHNSKHCQIWLFKMLGSQKVILLTLLTLMTLILTKAGSKHHMTTDLLFLGGSNRLMYRVLHIEIPWSNKGIF